MARGNAQQLSELIDDTNKSKKTTFSSEHIQDLLNQSGAEETVYLLTISDTQPTTFQEGDKYYSPNTKLVYTATNNTTFNSGENPKKNILYIDQHHNSLIVWNGIRMNSYGGGGLSNVSAEPNNATVVLDDGIYTPDLSDEVRRINIAQKTVNEEMGYADLKMDNIRPTLNIPLTFTRKSGNLEATTDKVKLRAGHRYNITVCFSFRENSSKTVDIVFTIKDITNNIIIKDLNPTHFNASYEYADMTGVIYVPDTDCEISIIPTSINTNKTIAGSRSTFIIQEIGRTFTIDPVNYINTTQGIEDVPVGTLIEVEGPQNPDHYLLCDGSTYNIEDYRYLAEAIKKVYGKYNYFGGDGVDTFAVPMHTDTNEWFSPKQISNSNPYNVSASSTYNSWPVWWAFNNNCTTSLSNAWHSAVGSSTGHWIQIDFKVTKALAGISIAPRPEGDYAQSRSPIDFDVMGSYDGSTWTVIKSYKGITDYKNNQYREFVFDAPVRYRYYRIANIRVSSNCVNIADIHFLSVPEKYVYIKYEPTYFIGTINGYEERKTLMDTPALIPCTNGMLKPGTEISLSESLDNYDYVEVHVGADYAGTPFGKHVTRIPISEIIYSPTKNEWANTYQEWICDQNVSFALWYGFKDVQTLYVSRMQANVNSNPDNYRGCQIIKIVGIRNKYGITESIN